MHHTKGLVVAVVLLVCSSCLSNAQIGRLANLSTRATCQTGDSVLVNEFIIQGTGTESLVLRALGSSLLRAGIRDALRNPAAFLLNPRGDILDSNDNWMDNPDKDAIIAAGLAPTDPREAALLDTLAPGLYTFIEEGVHRGTGVAVAEFYDLADGGLQLSALGTRGPVLTGNSVMVSGFVITGTGPTSLLIRALGPSLADAGLSGVLPDPYLELHFPSGALISNDNWRDTQEQEIEATGLAPADDLESAMVVTLAPGAYTVILSGVGGTTGLGFLQIYSLDLPIRELNPAPITGRGH